MVDVLVLAGGIATRLRPITEKIPKAMVDINGFPFIDYQLRNLKRYGFNKVVISLGYLGQMVEDYVLDKQQKLSIAGSLEWPEIIEFIYDGPKLLGTGGAVLRTLKMKNISSVFVVLYGDSYLLGDYQEIVSAFNSESYDALMTVFKNTNLYDQSNVIFSDNKIIKYDKQALSAGALGQNQYDQDRQLPPMQHIDWGFNVFHERSFKAFFRDDDYVFDLAQVFQYALSKNRLQGYEVQDRFYEIGSKSGLAELRDFLG